MGDACLREPPPLGTLPSLEDHDAAEYHGQGAGQGDRIEDGCGADEGEDQPGPPLAAEGNALRSPPRNLHFSEIPCLLTIFYKPR